MKDNQIKFSHMIIFLILFIFVLSTFYSGRLNKSYSNSPEIINFRGIKNKYFIQYSPEFIPSLIRPGNASASIRIHRDNLSSEEMTRIQQQLVSDGWRRIKDEGRYSQYCLNKTQILNIGSPVTLKKRNGEIIQNDKVNSWIISLYYNDNGVNSCY